MYIFQNFVQKLNNSGSEDKGSPPAKYIIHRIYLELDRIFYLELFCILLSKKNDFLTCFLMGCSPFDKWKKIAYKLI